MKNKLPLGRYIHYKGNEYIVLGFAHHTETRQPMVLYTACYDVPELHEQYGQPVIFARPYESFIKKVYVNNQLVQRFTLKEPSNETLSSKLTQSNPILNILNQ